LSYNPVGNTHTVTATITPAASGFPIDFLVTGANTASGTIDTDEYGDAKFPYEGLNSGIDTITATFDGVTLTAYKYWFLQGNWLTGGATVKTDDGKKGKPDWSLAGNLGVVEGIGIVGQIQINNQKTGAKYHLNSFSFLEFSGGDATSPDANNNTAEFVGTDGTIEERVEIRDLGEPGAGVDELRVDIGNDGSWEIGTDNPLQITTGNYQIHGVEPVIYQMIECPINYPTEAAPGVAFIAFTSPSSGILRIELDLADVLFDTQYDVWLGVDSWVGTGGMVGIVTTDPSGNYSGYFDWLVTTGTHRMNVDITLHGSGSDIYELPGIHGSPGLGLNSPYNDDRLSASVTGNREGVGEASSPVA
jgi:hypothetical protein